MSLPCEHGHVCFGDRLRALAKARGLSSPRALAGAIGCSVATARRYLDAITPPQRCDLLAPIVAALDVSYAALLDGVRGQCRDRPEDVDVEQFTRPRRVVLSLVLPDRQWEGHE